MEFYILDGALRVSFLCHKCVIFFYHKGHEGVFTKDTKGAAAGVGSFFSCPLCFFYFVFFVFNFHHEGHEGVFTKDTKAAAAGVVFVFLFCMKIFLQVTINNPSHPIFK